MLNVMSNYDSLSGFINYTDKEEWKKYVENYVLPLWKSTSTLKEFYENLKSEFNNAFLQDIKEEDLPLLLGGVDPSEGEIYKKNSLARFYNRFFGLKLSDIQSWILGGELAGIQLKALVEETEFTRFVNEVFKWIDRAMKRQSLVPYKQFSIGYEELKKNPDKLKDVVKEFYESVLKISVNYNYYTFFLWSIKQIPYRFMKEAYPRIDQIIDFLKNEFGLTKLRWKIPFSEDSSLYKEYTIWCWPEYNAPSEKGGYCGPEYNPDISFGGSICVLNEKIWKYMTKGYSPTHLEKIILDYFNIFPYLREEYENKFQGTLIGKMYGNIYYRGITASEDESKLGQTNMTLMQMIDEISPYLFTGIAKIYVIEENRIGISKV